MSALLEVQGLETAYGSSQVLFGIDLQVESGQVATLLGLTRARSGSVRFQGHRIEALAPDRIARMGLAVVPEGRQIFPNLTVRENLVAFAANRHGAQDPWTLECHQRL